MQIISITDLIQLQEVSHKQTCFWIDMILKGCLPCPKDRTLIFKDYQDHFKDFVTLANVGLDSMPCDSHCLRFAIDQLSYSFLMYILTYQGTVTASIIRCDCNPRYGEM